MNIRIKLLNPRCNPLKQRDGDVGADVQSMIQTIINPGCVEKVPLGFALEIPDGYFGFVVPRSGLSSKGRAATIGTVDPSYRGELNAIAYNSGRMPWVIEIGERIAQLVILPAPRITFDPCTELSATGRGSNGFGSSGIGPYMVDGNGSPL
jgi:dUTP pyrophosphatase